MINEIIQAVFEPKNPHGDDWPILKTDNCYYNLRLGGFERVIDSIEEDNFYKLKLPFKNAQVENVLSNDEDVFYFVQGGYIVETGWQDIMIDGELVFGLCINKISDYESGFFETSDLFNICLGDDNFSTGKYG